MRCLPYASCLVLLSVCTVSPAPVQAEATVKVEANATVIHVSAEIDTAVNRDLAWKVLTDYTHWAEFIPDMIMSRVVSRPGEPLLIEQRGVIPWMPNFPLVVIASVQEKPKHSLRFQRVAGNLRAFEGEWRVQGRSKVRLIYRSTVEPGFPLPPQMSIEIFRHDAKAKLEAMAQEMTRRKSLAARTHSRQR
jgi:hypothetical protein